MTQPDEPHGDAGGPSPPLPRERWKGPPGGAPDPIAESRRGCAVATMLIFGGILMVPGLCASVYAFNVTYFALGPYAGIFVASLGIGLLGLILVGIALQRGRSAAEASASRSETASGS
ncbi:hypothetical protein ACVIJ6_002066 [Bradyrhizobium sp. USDA 4369]